MAEQKETFGQRFMGGIAWGLGFTIVAVPVGLILHSLLDDLFEKDEEAEPWHRLGMTYEEYREAIEEHQRRREYDDEE